MTLAGELHAPLYWETHPDRAIHVSNHVQLVPLDHEMYGDLAAVQTDIATLRTQGLSENEALACLAAADGDLDAALIAYATWRSSVDGVGGRGGGGPGGGAAGAAVGVASASSHVLPNYARDLEDLQRSGLVR